MPPLLPLFLAAVLALQPGAQTSPTGSLELPREGEVDLRAVAVAAPGDGHVRVRETSPGTLYLEPADGVRLADERSMLRTKGAQRPSRWMAPKPSDPAFRPSKGVLLSSDRDLGTRVFAALDHGTVLVLSLSGARGARPVLVVEEASGEQRLLLPAPEVPPALEPDGPESWSVDLARPADRPAALDPLVGVRFEVAPSATDDWRLLTETAPGSATVPGTRCFPAGGDAVLVRVRARFTDASGRASAPGPYATVVRGAATEAERRARVDEAIASLEDADYARRVEARAVLVALAADARPRLEALEVELGGGGDRALALAVADVLTALDEAEGAALSARRLVRHAREQLERSAPDASAADGFDAASLGDPPADLLAVDPHERAAALLRLYDRAQRGAPRAGGQGFGGQGFGGLGVERAETTLARAATWLTALAQLDPDPRVRSLAGFVVEVAPRPSVAAFEAPAPAWLLPPAQRFADEPLPSAADGSLPASAVQLAWDLEARPELADLDLGPPLATLVEALLVETSAPSIQDDAVYDYDVRSVDLVLRLLERARQADPGDRGPFLAAAEVLLADPADVLAGERAVFDRRVAEPSRASAPARRRIEVETADAGALEGALADVGASDWAGVDILLPPGRYDFGTDEARFLDVRTGGLRIAPLDPTAGPVVLAMGVRIFGVRDVVLEDVAIQHEHGQALTVLTGGHVALVRSELASHTKVLHVQDSDVELVDSRIRTLEGAAAYAVLAQTIGRARILARATSFRGGSIFLGQGAGTALLDRCVVDSGDRPMLQGQGEARVIVRESLLSSDGLGIVGVGEGLLVASVVDCEQQPVGRGVTGLRLSPRLLDLGDTGGTVPSSLRLDVEPFRPR